MPIYPVSPRELSTTSGNIILYQLSKEFEKDVSFDVIRRQNTAIVVGGDDRCCSLVHTAKYGSYSLMDLELGQILDVQLVQVQNQCHQECHLKSF